MFPINGYTMMEDTHKEHNRSEYQEVRAIEISAMRVNTPRVAKIHFTMSIRVGI